MKRLSAVLGVALSTLSLIACQGHRAALPAPRTNASVTPTPGAGGFSSRPTLQPQPPAAATRLPTTSRCEDRHLRVEAAGSDAGGGHVIYWISATNVGRNGCTLSGRPKILIARRPQPAWQYAGSWLPEEKVPARLQPGQAALAVITNVPSCEYPKRLWASPHHYTSLSVVLPEGRAVPVSIDFASCYRFGVSRWFTQS